jgi:hypothetical protein
MLRMLRSGIGTRQTSICTATIPSADVGPTDVGDAHRGLVCVSAQRACAIGCIIWPLGAG